MEKSSMFRIALDHYGVLFPFAYAKSPELGSVPDMPLLVKIIIGIIVLLVLAAVGPAAVKWLDDHHAEEDGAPAVVLVVQPH
jgi:hypothetical protein